MEASTATDGAADPTAAAPVDAATARMWTYRVRRRALKALPPGKLLPDSQPAYVASWAYVFGVASIAALGVAIVTGSYPGQPWLWLYTLWYQVPGWSNSANIDMLAIYMTGLATILLLLVPFIPGLRDIPRLIPVHRLIWRDQDTPAPVPDLPAPGSGVPAPASGAGNGKVPSPSGAGHLWS